MKKKIVVILLTICLIIIGIGIVYYNRNVRDHDDNEYERWHSYNRDIFRNSDSSQEDAYIIRAENLDYKLYLNQSRFIQGDNIDISEYGVANYINNEVIQYYWDYFQNQYYQIIVMSDYFLQLRKYLLWLMLVHRQSLSAHSSSTCQKRLGQCPA